MDAEIKPTDAVDGVADLAEREAEYEKFVWDNLRRNYLGNYLHGMLGMTGFRLVNAPTFLPAYLHMISGSNSIVGLGLALQQLGGIISPIFAGTQIEHRKKVMPAALWMGGLGRLAIPPINMASGMTLVLCSTRVAPKIGVRMPPNCCSARPRPTIELEPEMACR